MLMNHLPDSQTVVTNRNTAFIGTKALSTWSSGVSMERSFLRQILTDIVGKLLSSVLNTVVVKGVYGRIF